MNVTAYSLSRGHIGSALCEGHARRRQQAKRNQAARAAQAVNFTLDGTVLGKTGSFKYLGRIVSENDSDWPALQKNLTKARQRWASISRLLGREGATPKVSGYIYKAAILTVLLYSSETWVWSQRMLKACEGFHHRAA